MATKIVISKKDEKIVSICVSGHTGFADSGSDILCASISAIIQTASLGILKLVSKNVDIISNDEPPKFKITLPDNLSSDKYLQAKLILDTAILGLEDLQSGYPKYIKMEVKNDVY